MHALIVYDMNQELLFLGVFLQEYLRALLDKHNNFEVDDEDFTVVLQPFFSQTEVPRQVKYTDTYIAGIILNKPHSITL